MSDWHAIKLAYEAGASLRDIVDLHGSSIATISRVVRREGWIRQVKLPETRNGKRVKHETPLAPLPVSMPMDAVSIARAGLKQLAQHLQGQTTPETLTIAAHKSLSDALAQYVKVLASPMEEQDAPEGLVIPLDRISARTRMEIRRLLAEDDEQQRREGVG